MRPNRQSTWTDIEPIGRTHCAGTQRNASEVTIVILIRAPNRHAATKYNEITLKEEKKTMPKKTEAEDILKRNVAHLGWKPDLPDAGSSLFRGPLTALRATPEKVDLRSKCPPFYDQGQPLVFPTT